MIADPCLCSNVFHKGMRPGVENVHSLFYWKGGTYEIKKENTVRIEVQDFGEGIDPKDLDNIWDRYYKVDKEHVRVANGSGIGLNIVKQLLELHGVPYGVNSSKGKGSTFYFEMPIEKENQ